jgi:U3 small nucleolar RNA-associated protein 13
MKIVEVVPDEDMYSDDDDDDDDDDSGGGGGNDENGTYNNNNDDDGDNEQDDQGKVASKTTTATIGGGLLSKSWSVASAHVPTFTGGKVTISYCGPTPSTTTTRTTTNHEPFLLLPVNGDLAIVDAKRGVKWGTIRTGSAVVSSAVVGRNNDYTDDGGDADNEDDDEDGDGIDQDSIASYALDHTNQSIITCTRSNLMRQYAVRTVVPLKVSTDDDDNDNNTSPSDHQPRGNRCTTELLYTLGRSGHTLPVTCMEFHKSDAFVATGSVDGSVRIWDVRGRYVTHVFRPLAGGDGGGSGRLSVTSIQWRPKMDELVIAIGRDDGSIVIHNLRKDIEDKSNSKGRNNKNHSHGVIAILRDHVSAVTCMDWWGDEFFVSTGRDAILNLWRIVTVDDDHDDDTTGQKDGGKKKKLKSKIQLISGLSSSDTASHDVRIIYRRIQTIPVYEQIEGMVVFPPSSSRDGKVDGQNSDSAIHIVTAGSKGCLRKWKAEVIAGQTPELVQTLEQPSSQTFGDARGGYTGLALNHFAAAAAMTASSTQTTFKETQQQQVLVAVDAENNLSFVDNTLSLNRTIVGHNDEILDLKIIPTTTSVVVATNSPQVRIFDLQTFSCSVLDGHTGTVLCVDASPCGRYLASCGKDKTMRLWSMMIDVDDRGGPRHRCVGIATGHTEPIGACGLSQQIGRYEVGGKAARNGGGAFCVTASVDRTLKRWNLLGPEDWDIADGPVDLVAATSVRGHEKDINIISIAPNDSIVASGSQDKTVKLWNATDLTLKATLKGHRRGVWDCQFSPIDRVVATSSGDKTVKLWSLADYSCVRTFQGHLSSVLRVRFLSTGLQLVSSGADGLIKVWTIRTNECETTLDGHSNKVWAMDLAYGGAVASDNNNNSKTGKDLLVSGGADSKLLVWEDTTAILDEEERAQKAEGILLDQKMENHLRHKEYHKALEIALKVDKPMQTYKVLTALLENDARKQTATTTTAANKRPKSEAAVLREHVAKWDLDRVAQVLKYCRDWNTRARNAPLAMWMVQAIVTTIPVERLTSKEGTHTPHGSIPELLAGITPYAERHFDRLDRLHASSFLLDYLLYNLSSLDPIVAQVDDDDDDKFAQWEAGSKLVLPPKYIDGRIQVGGKALVGRSSDELGRKSIGGNGSDDDDDDSDTDDVMTVGDSSTSDDSNNANGVPQNRENIMNDGDDADSESDQDD